MKLSDELLTAAQNYGRVLSETSQVNEFRMTEQAVKNDPEASDLENRLNMLYTHLASQEQSGEALDRGELDEYYLLRSKLMENPLISAREDQRQMVKLLFADVNETMTAILGLDFTVLAL